MLLLGFFVGCRTFKVVAAYSLPRRVLAARELCGLCPPTRRQSTWGRIGTPGSSRRVCYCRGGILRVVRVLLAARPAGVIGSKPSLTGAPQSGWAAAGAPRI